MCDRHHTPTAPDRAIALEHGAAHDHDHAVWSRREFLTRSAAAAGGTAFVLGGMPVQATSGTSLLHALAQLNTDRILVLIQLGGGNDGLNTIIPKTNDTYYQRRPTLGIPANETVSLNSEFGMHPNMQALEPLWGNGQMSVIQSVGYPDPSLSHFRSTDIWASASNSDEVRYDGWTGRYFDHEFPNYVSDPPDFPVAIRIGSATELLMRGAQTSMGMSFSDPDQIQQLADTGELYDETDVPNNFFGEELSFVRSVYNAALRYRDAVVAATEAGSNEAEYPEDDEFAESMAAVARLIKGNLGARIYVVNIGGFDTHANQAQGHGNKLLRLSEAVAAFQEDLGNQSQDVLTMTFSEFGRRVEENGSNGTDHGTAAPLLLFGRSVAGGLYGDDPDLVDLDSSGNMHFTTDFRQIYKTVLNRWFGLPETQAHNILGGSFSMLDFIANPVSTEPTAVPSAFVLETPYPNPFHGAATVAYALDQPGHVSLTAYDVRGREVARLASGAHTAGRHTARFEGTDLPSGTYLLRLEASGGTQTQPITLVR